MHLLFPLLLTGCTAATAARPSPEAVRGTTEDVRGTAQGIHTVRQEVEALSSTRRDRAATSLATLSVNCPYTRAGLQLPIALQEALRPLSVDHLDPVVHADLAHLHRGLADHVAIFDALRVDLPLPQPGDALFGPAPVVVVTPPPDLVDRKTLEAASDPIALTRPFVSSVPQLVETLEPDAMELIQHHTREAEQAMGHPWTLKPYVDGWRAALIRLEPFVTDAPMQQRVRASIEVLNAYAGMGC